MDLGLITIGVMVLVALAVAIGAAQAADRSARTDGWRKLAEGRRRNWEEQKRVHELWDEINRCRDCPYRRRDPDDRG